MPCGGLKPAVMKFRISEQLGITRRYSVSVAGELDIAAVVARFLKGSTVGEQPFRVVVAE
jgi:hypothetical protein